MLKKKIRFSSQFVLVLPFTLSGLENRVGEHAVAEIYQELEFGVAAWQLKHISDPAAAHEQGRIVSKICCDYDIITVITLQDETALDRLLKMFSEMGGAFCYLISPKVSQEVGQAFWEGASDINSDVTVAHAHVDDRHPLTEVYEVLKRMDTVREKRPRRAARADGEPMSVFKKRRQCVTILPDSDVYHHKGCGCLYDKTQGLVISLYEAERRGYLPCLF